MDLITERQIIGEYYKTLQSGAGAAWVDGIANYFTSDQASEQYAWLGMTPALREWIGGRNAKGFLENNIEIKNKHYEATIDFLLRDLRRDKTGQAMVRIQELAKRTNSHWASLLSTLIIAGESALCYDGQAFFDTDHSEGDSGTQDNDRSITITDLPEAIDGSTTRPSVEQMQLAIAEAISAIVSFKDDRGEPMNEDAQSFMAMVPITYLQAGLQAVQTPIQVDASQTALTALKQNFSITCVPNVRLTWTTKFAVFRTDGFVKPFIRQEEMAVSLKVKGEGSEYEFDNDAWQFGVDTWRNVGYGQWQQACLITFA